MRFSEVLNVVKCHTGGEVNNVVTGGLPRIPGATAFDKQQWLEKNRDDLRQRLLFEPRGAVTHCVNFVTPSENPEASFAYIIAESTEYPAMSGSNTICTATALLETGMIPVTEPVTKIVLEAPAGLIQLRCDVSDGKVTGVTFQNQPAFVYDLDVPVDVPGYGTVSVDIAWGGMAYAIVRAADFGLDLVPSEARKIAELGELVKRAAAAEYDAVHPVNPDFPGITQTQFAGPLSRTTDGDLAARNAVVVTPGRLDRSACGTGTSARLAVLHARGEINPGEKLVHSSIMDSIFEGFIHSTTTVGGVDAVIPEITGQAWITELSQVGLDPTDPFPNGFTLSDMWGTSDF